MLFSAALIWIDIMSGPHVGKLLELENQILGVHLIKQMQVGKALLPAMPREDPLKKAGCWVLWNQKTRSLLKTSIH